jgi:hypothetical protein
MHLYDRRFIEKHHLRFPEGVQHEDVIWTTRLLVLAKRVAYDSVPLYVYRSADVEQEADNAGEASDASIGSRTMAYVRRNAGRFSRAALDERLVRIIEGAKINASALAEIASSTDDARLARAIRWQLVDGGLSVFQKIRQLSTAEQRQAQWRKALEEGYLSLLWRNAGNLLQKRKIAARFVRAVASRFN